MLPALPALMGAAPGRVLGAVTSSRCCDLPERNTDFIFTAAVTVRLRGSGFRPRPYRRPEDRKDACFFFLCHMFVKEIALYTSN